MYRIVPGPPSSLPANLEQLLEDRLSAERLKPYDDACSGDRTRAVALYTWNFETAAAFGEVMGQFEVVLRNALHNELTAWHARRGRPGEWYDDPSGLLDAKGHADIANVRDRLQRESKPELPGSVVAELTFGFWRVLLSSRYQATLWARRSDGRSRTTPGAGEGTSTRPSTTSTTSATERPTTNRFTPSIWLVGTA